MVSQYDVVQSIYDNIQLKEYYSHEKIDLIIVNLCAYTFICTNENYRNNQQTLFGKKVSIDLKDTNKYPRFWLATEEKIHEYYKGV